MDFALPDEGSSTWKTTTQHASRVLTTFSALLLLGASCTVLSTSAYLLSRHITASIPVNTLLLGSSSLSSLYIFLYVFAFCRASPPLHQHRSSTIQQACIVFLPILVTLWGFALAADLGLKRNQQAPPSTLVTVICKTRDAAAGVALTASLILCFLLTTRITPSCTHPRHIASPSPRRPNKLPAWLSTPSLLSLDSAICYPKQMSAHTSSSDSKSASNAGLGVYAAPAVAFPHVPNAEFKPFPHVERLVSGKERVGGGELWEWAALYKPVGGVGRCVPRVFGVVVDGGEGVHDLRGPMSVLRQGPGGVGGSGVGAGRMAERRKSPLSGVYSFGGIGDGKVGGRGPVL